MQDIPFSSSVQERHHSEYAAPTGLVYLPRAQGYSYAAPTALTAAPLGELGGSDKLSAILAAGRAFPAARPHFDRFMPFHIRHNLLASRNTTFHKTRNRSITR